MPEQQKISLVLADVGGTLLTEQKILTKRAQAAVAALREAHVRFAITSGRPPRGVAMLFEALQLDTPIAGFNGGLFVKPDLSIIEHKTLAQDVADQTITLLRQHELDVWTGNDWLITKPGAPHVAREAWTVKFDATVVSDFSDRLEAVAKIVGVSDDLERVRQCEVDVQAALGQRATANRSQPYYLDVTHKDANKGRVVDYLSTRLAIPSAEIATVGDSPNDILMFKHSGFSIAIGNASDEVKSQATTTTDSYNDEGFAKAIERFVLGDLE